jgi:mono/diheme cytochrome c family protein
MKRIYNISLLMIVLIAFASCKKDSRPNYQYMPNMYESIGYEAYSESDAFRNGMEAQLPVDETIARGHDLYEIENTNEGYALAKANLVSPLDSTQVEEMRGGQLYDIYCAICHGKNGNGQGNLVKREKILGVPAYNDAGRAITPGSIYHVNYYGKNTMGSYANQLNEEERWQVVNYVMKLKSELGGSQTVKDSI